MLKLNENSIWIVRDSSRPNVGMIFTPDGKEIKNCLAVTVELNPHDFNTAIVKFYAPNFANTIEEMNDAIRIMKANEFEASIREGKMQ